MRTVIDRCVCIHSGQCHYLQPKVFSVDDKGVPVIFIEKPTVDQVDRASDAGGAAHMELNKIKSLLVGPPGLEPGGGGGKLVISAT